MESGNGTVPVRGGGGLSWDIWAVGNWGETTTTTTASGASGAAAAAAAASTTATCPTPYHNPDQRAVQTMTSFSTSTFSPLQHHYGCGGYGGGAGGGEAHHHLTCLKLGKRQYYEGGRHVAAEEVLPRPSGGGMGVKKEKVVGSSSSSASPPPHPSSAAPAVVPRCQVEGCNVALVDAKDYHRRHKVCEAHSKAPKVVVLGLEQRFCQQCSRFHVISEFDDSKRSCRRRLAGHNERRRKSSNESIIRNPSLDNTLMGGRFPYVSSSTCPGRALSLLSAEASPWVPSDLSYRSSAALRELIAENRAALLARQLLLDRGCYSSGQETNAVYSEMPHHHSVPYGIPQSQLCEEWHHFHEANPHVTLDLMQVPSSSFEILSGRNKPRQDEEECCEIWKTLEETHVV